MAEIELLAAPGQMVLEFAEGLVLLIGDAGDGHLQGLADLRDRPAARPELDDAILTDDVSWWVPGRGAISKTTLLKFLDRDTPPIAEPLAQTGQA